MYAHLVDFIKRNPSKRFENRVDLYRHVNECHLERKRLSFVELGVLRGETLSNWIALNTDPGSRFVGLDTFEGLPEEWQHLIGKSPLGTFTTHGEVPKIVDSRVSFVKGLIQDNLPSLVSALDLSESALVVHFDADLYSTTLFGLTAIDCLLFDSIDSYIAVFDEFSSANDEYRAFRDYGHAYRRPFRVLGHTGGSYDQVAIQISLS